MKKLDIDTFTELLTLSPIKPRLKRELRFVTSTADLTDQQWDDRELLPIADRSGNNGVLLVSLDDDFYILPYEFKRGITSSVTGRNQSIICDFCQTWQNGSNAGSITFPKDRNSTVSYLVCGDLKCSLHVRTQTKEAHTSRAQLREDVTIEQRVTRLKRRVAGFITNLPYSPTTI